MIKKIGVYKIEIGGKFYIGSTVSSFKRRWGTHLQEFRKGTHDNPYLQNAFNKYGEGDLKFTIIEIVLNLEDVIIREQKYIDELNPEYNICRVAGNCLGVKHTDTTRQKMSKANKGKNLSERHKQKIKEALQGHIVSDETRSKIRQAVAGHKYALGYRHSEETISKFKKAFKGRKVSIESRQKISNSTKGHVVSAETRLKISTAMKGNTNGLKTKGEER